jgi:hypothetical protein
MSHQTGEPVFEKECIKFFRFANMPIGNRRRCAMPNWPTFGVSERVQFGWGTSENHKAKKATL